MGDYADTLMLPNLGTMAIIRWMPGPAEVIGTGTAVLHCHILPVRTSLFSAVSSPVREPCSLHAGIIVCMVFHC